jgi:glutamyl-tRNA synthetase
LIRGAITVEADHLDDFIIMRSDGTPTYNFVVVVDDADMNISHVIRGEDHISNTPKQILLYRACGFKEPQFGHLPLIVGSSGQRLSKRDAATSVLDYKSAGFLPDALCNYLVRLGWSYKDQEIFTRNELISYFSLDGVGKKSSVFDMDKLRWVNNEYIKQKNSEELYTYITCTLSKDLRKSADAWGYEKILHIINLYKSRAHTLKDLIDYVTQLLRVPDSYNYEALSKWSTDDLVMRLDIIHVALCQQDNFSADNIKLILKRITQNLSLSLPDIAKPLRVALTGDVSSPSIFDITSLLGIEQVCYRIKKLHDALKAL